ncbi:MAG: HEAT repeat domain-containing protein [Planctomycetes bacterium]|nr:HEAT repeat domain-containing protein [Planctomycetota bacterium]
MAFDVAYKKLQDTPVAACAAAVPLFRTTEDDFVRLSIVQHLEELAGEKAAAPFIVWTFSKVKDLGSHFQYVYEWTRLCALEQNPTLLPAVFAILRTHDQSIFLRAHSWHIRTHECMYYVLGGYGRGVIPYLRPMLRHEDPYVRRNAAFALGLFFDDSSEKALAKMLEAKDVGSGGAAFALGELHRTKHVRAIAQVLKSADAPTRFWAAYALYELGDKEAVPFLKAAADNEKDEDTLKEMKAAIERLSGDMKPLGSDAKKLDAANLGDLLTRIEKDNGLSTEDAGSIAISAGKEHLNALERIRYRSTQVPSDRGNKSFHIWCNVIKEVRRRSE